MGAVHLGILDTRLSIDKCSLKHKRLSMNASRKGNHPPIAIISKERTHQALGRKREQHAIHGVPATRVLVFVPICFSRLGVHLRTYPLINGQYQGPICFKKHQDAGKRLPCTRVFQCLVPFFEDQHSMHLPSMFIAECALRSTQIWNSILETQCAIMES